MNDAVSLYRCEHARVKGDKIYCSAGHAIGKGGNLRLPLKVLQNGERLRLKVCQYCPDYVCLGQEVEELDRGW
jgi:hypothetical protein